MNTGYVYIWEYIIDPSYEREFLAAYEPNGLWVELFRQHEGFIRTELHRDLANPARFVTVDYWVSRVAWKTFREGSDAMFRELDERCEEYTISETEIGAFAPCE